MMNSFKRANASLTHAKIVNEYENKLRALERENERLNAHNDKLQRKVDRVEIAKHFITVRIHSLRNSLKREPDKIKKEQLKLLRNIQEELK